MKNKCPNNNCTALKNIPLVVRDGHYYRRGDSRKVQRYKCKVCGKKFSSSTGTLAFRQRKRRLNSSIAKLLTSGVSIRRTAKIVGVHQDTISRRMRYLAKVARKKNHQLLMRKAKEYRRVQLDDLITKEKSKLLPVSVSLLVDQESYKILGANVSRIPSFGHLSKISRKKYGPRPCQHKDGLGRLFKQVKPYLAESFQIRSDEHNNYPPILKELFPSFQHFQFPSERATIAGQGELKKNKRDPLFAVNHACAMLRANLSRLIRRTWCTTQKIEKLQEHIDLFIWIRNRYLEENPRSIPT